MQPFPERHPPPAASPRLPKFLGLRGFPTRWRQRQWRQEGLAGRGPGRSTARPLHPGRPSKHRPSPRSQGEIVHKCSNEKKLLPSWAEILKPRPQGAEVTCKRGCLLDILGLGGASAAAGGNKVRQQPAMASSSLGGSWLDAPKSSLPFRLEGPLKVPAEARPEDKRETVRKRPGARETSCPNSLPPQGLPRASYQEPLLEHWPQP